MHVDSTSEAMDALSVYDNYIGYPERTHSETVEDIDTDSVAADPQAILEYVPDQDRILASTEASPAPANYKAVDEQEPLFTDPSVTPAVDEDILEEEVLTLDPSQTLVAQCVEETQICHVCCEVQFSDLFPSRLPTSTCKHAMEVCRLCLEKSIAEQMAQKIWDQIDCPTCSERMGFFDVKEFANTVTFEK